MRDHRQDREKKGHFLFPCAGSVFKNNRAFGAPTGQLVDSLGLKGRRIGGAQIAPFHGNIFINTGGARRRTCARWLSWWRPRCGAAWGSHWSAR